MIENEPMTVQSRGRLYTDDRQRREIETTPTRYGYETPIHAVVITVDRSPEWGIYSQAAEFETELQQYGEFQIPSEVRKRLDIEEGDSVRVSIGSLMWDEADSSGVERTIEV